MDTEFSGDLSGDECAVGKKDGSERMVSQDLIDFPEIGMEQRFPSGEKESQPMDLFKFF
jgi:hypothetical protein